jgi:N-acetylmuramoyl-L-alanine amidase
MVQRTRILSAMLFLLACILSYPSDASAFPASEFKQGWKEFHVLLKNPRKAKYRSNWYAVKDRFQRAYTQSPKGSYAPKALFYLGRVYDEMSKVSMVRSDALQAVDYYQRVVLRFPGHSWADDALYREAEVQLHQLKDKDQAYISLLSIVHTYPKGDMVPQARKLLDSIDRTQREKQVASVKNKAASPVPKVISPPVRPPANPRPFSASPGIVAPVHLTGIRHWSSNAYTRIVLDLDNQAEFYNRLLKPDPALRTPHRLFIDLKKTALGPDIPDSMNVVDGILRGIRTSRHTADDIRVVLDINQIDTFRVFSLPDPFRVVVDVYGARGNNIPVQPVVEGKTVVASVKNNAVVGQNARSKGVARSLVEQLGLKIQTIMIDAGHGGKDPGAVANNIREKNINLKMAKILGKKLAHKGFRILYTRTSDVFIPLEERTAMANAKDADLFISVHCNACNNKRAHGLELYYLNLAKSRDAVRVAARENAVSVKKISDLQVILTDLMLNSKITESKDLANDIQNRALHRLRAKYQVNNHGVKGAPFYVLMGSKMPAVLAEIGYISNYTEAKRLRSSAYLERLADGMVQGVLAYQQRIEGFASLK